MDGCDRSVVACIHGLQHIEAFLAAYLAEDDPVGTHAKCIADQFSLVYGTFTLYIWRSSLKPYYIGLLELQFGWVFNCDDALIRGNESRKDVQERRLS
jgi:hypothetical protein